MAACRRTQGKQGLGDIEQRADIGHAHQAETDPLAAARVALVMRLMQLQAGIAHMGGELGALLLWFVGGQSQWQQLGTPQR